MNRFDNKTKNQNFPGMSLAIFVILWLLVCVITAGATIYASEIKRCFCGLTDIFGLHSKAEERNLPNSEVNIDSDKFNIPQKDELRRNDGGCDKNADEKALPASNSTEEENLKTLSEELEKPVKALCDFLRTDDIRYLYKALSPGCIAYLKEKYADAIVLLGGESSAVKNVLDEDLLNYESVTGKLTDISCDIYEITEASKSDLSEMNGNLRGFGSKQDIKRGYRLKIKFNFRGEFASSTTDKTLRVIETEAGWFIFFGDLIRSELQ